MLAAGNVNASRTFISSGGNLRAHRLHRDHTISDLMWDYVKDLSRLGRDLARVVIVDDNPLMFMYQPDNALHIGAYEPACAGGPDNVLERVADVLIKQVCALLVGAGYGVLA